jgi:hypothetical protein
LTAGNIAESDRSADGCGSERALSDASSDNYHEPLVVADHDWETSKEVNDFKIGNTLNEKI